MRTRLRLGLLACVSLAAPALAGTASAAFAPKLAISATAATGTTIRYFQPPGDDALLKTTIYAPGGSLTANLTAAPGTTIGTIAAKTQAGALGGATLPLTGTVVVRGAADTYLSSGTPVPLANAAMACTGSPIHTTFWVLVLSAAGQTLEVPSFVDAIADPDPRAAFASAAITLCLPTPYVPPPVGAAFGAKVFDAALSIKGVFAGPGPQYTWRALATPWTPGTATPNPAGTQEVQSHERPVGDVSATAKRGKGKQKNTATVSGFVSESGLTVPDASIVIRGGTKAVATKTDVGGEFTATVKLRGKSTKTLKVTAVAPTRDEGAVNCIPTFASLNIPCTDVTIGGFAVTKTIKVK